MKDRNISCKIAQTARVNCGFIAPGLAMSERVEMMSDEQRRTLNAACGDLAEQIVWHGFRLTKDDWRHMLAGTIRGWRMMPGIDRGEGPGFIMLGGSSMSLLKSDAADAITQAFLIGDDPSSQGLNCPPVQWCSVICQLRWIVQEAA